MNNINNNFRKMETISGEVTTILIYGAKNREWEFIVNETPVKYKGFLRLEVYDNIIANNCYKDGDHYVSQREPKVIVRLTKNKLKYYINVVAKTKPQYKSRIFKELTDCEGNIELFAIKEVDTLSIDDVYVKSAMIKKIDNYCKHFLEIFFSKDELFELTNGVYNYRDLILELAENPLKYYKIPMERALELCDYYDVKYTEQDIYCARIYRHIMERNIKRRWVCCPEKDIIQRFPLINENIKYLGEKFNVVKRDNFYYDRSIMDKEDFVIEYLNALIERNFMEETSINSIGEFDFDKTLSDEQKSIIKNTLSHAVSVLCGGPGFGKTKCITEACKNLMMNRKDFFILAFTGKAVSHIENVLSNEKWSDRKTMTVDRFIMFKEFHNAEYIFIDETSMCSTDLMFRLFSVLDRNRTRFIFVGDIDQLSPVSYGSFYRELFQSCRIPIYKLTKYFRSNTDRGIYENISGLVSKARDVTMPYNFIEKKGFRTVKGDIETVKKIIDALKKKHSYNEISVISPYNDVCNEINRYSMNKFFPEDHFIFMNYEKFKIGERLKITKNNYDLEIFNGQETFVQDINLETNTFTIHMKLNDDYIKVYDPEKDKEFELFKKKYKNADRGNIEMKKEENKLKERISIHEISKSFCKTIHSSQGSEYDIVICYFPNRGAHFVDINMLYTGLSRGKKSVFLVHEGDILENATKKTYTYCYDMIGKKLLERKTEKENSMNNLTVNTSGTDGNRFLEEEELFADEEEIERYYMMNY